MPVTPDGAILPSFLTIEDSDEGISGYMLGAMDPYLRVGRVSKVHKPDDDSNHSKKFMEYDIEIDVYSPSGAYTKIVYPRARVGSLFGAVADHSSWTPRVVSGEPDKINQGSLVLVLCVNGDTRQAVIIGGIAHPSLPKEDPDDGHHSSTEFNGIKFSVNKDGEYTVLFRGATKADGDLSDDADEDASGTSFTFKKNGSWLLQTKDDDQHILLDHENKKLDIKVHSETKIACSGNVNIESTGTKIGGGGANDSLMMGSTYRSAEQTMHGQMTSALSALSGQLGAAGAQLAVAGPALSVLAAPAATAISAAAAALSAAVAGIAQLSAAIQAFEAAAESYLSRKNTTD